MKAIITGAYGFIGSYVAEIISNRGGSFVVIDAGTIAAVNEDLVVALPGHFASVPAATDDPEAWKRIDALDFEPDVVLHLAAETHVDRSIGLDPTSLVATDEGDRAGLRFLRGNVEGTMRACAFAAAKGIPPRSRLDRRGIRRRDLARRLRGARRRPRPRSLFRRVREPRRRLPLRVVSLLGEQGSFRSRCRSVDPHLRNRRADRPTEQRIRRKADPRQARSRRNRAPLPRESGSALRWRRADPTMDPRSGYRSRDHSRRDQRHERRRLQSRRRRPTSEPRPRRDLRRGDRRLRRPVASLRDRRRPTRARPRLSDRLSFRARRARVETDDLGMGLDFRACRKLRLSSVIDVVKKRFGFFHDSA